MQQRMYEMNRSWRHLLWSVLVAAVTTPATAQQQDFALVATHLAGPGPTTQLLEVSLVTGNVATVGRFPSDHLPPLALSVDPIRRDPILAVTTTNGSRLLRLDLNGLVIVRETLLADVPGSVVEVSVVDVAGSVYALTGGAQGALFEVPRNGGPPRRVAPFPHATAMSEMALWMPNAWLATSGLSSPPTPPSMTGVDVRDGSVWSGPHPFPGFGATVITGLVEIPTALVRHLVTDDQGRLSLSVMWGTPVPMQLTPVLPPGATRSLRVRNFYEAVVLGGSAHPFLKTAQNPLGGPQPWITLAGPLPGDPVDFELLPAESAAVIEFGAACPRQASINSNATLPKLGNAQFQLQQYNGLANHAALLALGVSDQLVFGVPLPAVMPGGCSLYVSLQSLLVAVTDARGWASFLLPIPNDGALHGGILFAQWLQIDAALQVHGSHAAACHMYR
jgi:hypothetical protein